jgi:hypothetical protein
MGEMISQSSNSFRRIRIAMPQALRGLRRFLSSALVGGIAFWLPVIAVELLRRGQISPIAGTILPLATQLGCYVTLSRQRSTKRRLALSMLVGLYLVGPLSMEIGATAGGGGFSQFHGWTDAGYLLFCSLFPPATLMLSTYHMTLLSVILSSVSMLILHFTYERKGAGPS